MTSNTTPTGADPVLSFRDARFRFGRALAARGSDGSVYLYGRPAPDSPPCAWRQTPSGDRQWLGFDLPSQNAGTESLRRMARAVSDGTPHAILDWPFWDTRGMARERRTPVLITRDAAGIAFAPVGHGAEPLRISAANLGDFLSGRLKASLPGSSLDGAGTSARLLAALREARGLLTPGERLRAGAGMVMLASPLPERDPATRLLARCLERFTEAMAPMLDLHKPNRRILDLAEEALKPLRAAPVAKIGPQARAWVLGEASPLLVAMDARLKAHEAERILHDEFEVRGPAFA